MPRKSRKAQLDVSIHEIIFEKVPVRVEDSKLVVIHEILPEEIFVMILKMLDFKNLAMARGICSRWRKIINGFELLSLKNHGKNSYFSN